MKVREAMADTISTATPRDSIHRVAQLMKQEDAGFIPITEDSRLIGVITDRDIVIRCLADGHSDILNEAAEHCMSRDVRSIDADADLEDAAQVMSAGEIRRLPVTKDGRLVGILSHGNLVQATHARGPGEEATLGVTKGA